MIIVEYDKRSLKVHLSSDKDYTELKKFVEFIKSTIPSSCRVYNPDNHCWFMNEHFIQKLRENSNHLDINWERRI